MSGATGYGRTVQLFLVDGKPSGLRKVTIHGWTGIVFVSGSSAFADLRAREEVKRAGVYILAGPDPNRLGATRAYVGSANSVAERISQSSQNHLFWDVAIAVVTSDNDLSEGHTKFLEARLLTLANEANRVALANKQLPPSAGRLPEADEANMERFLDDVKLVLPVVGLDMLKPQPKAVANPSRPMAERTEAEFRFELQHKSGVKAMAMEQDGEFVVLEGTEVLQDSGSPGRTYAALRTRLIEEGVLVPLESQDVDGRAYRFIKPHVFSSPSAASAVILARNSNGRVEWKVAGTNQTYADHQEAQAAAKGAP